jgi:hypothetical protein
VGFVNVPWDGFVHAWILDEMVSSQARHRGVGLGLVHTARDGAKDAGCEWLHVDFDDHLRPFSYDAAGFTPTNSRLIDLTELDQSSRTVRCRGVNALLEASATGLLFGDDP